MEDEEYPNSREASASALPAGRALAPFVPNDSKTIVVNGRSHLVLTSEIGRGELMALAFPGAANVDPGALTIAYDHGPSTAPSGLLAPDRPVRVLHGQTFSVTLTDKS